MVRTRNKEVVLATVLRCPQFSKMKQALRAGRCQVQFLNVRDRKTGVIKASSLSTACRLPTCRYLCQALFVVNWGLFGVRRSFRILRESPGFGGGSPEPKDDHSPQAAGDPSQRPLSVAFGLHPIPPLLKTSPDSCSIYKGKLYINFIKNIRRLSCVYRSN